MLMMINLNDIVDLGESKILTDILPKKSKKVTGRQYKEAMIRIIKEYFSYIDDKKEYKIIHIEDIVEEQNNSHIEIRKIGETDFDSEETGRDIPC